MKLSKEFFLLILVAIVVGVPLSYFLLNRWKEGFAYATDLEWYTLLIGSIILFLISIGTILFHVRKISGNDPVKALRYE